MSFQGRNLFFRLDVWSTQVLTEALEHPETPQALKEVPCLWGKWFFPVRNCVDVLGNIVKGCKNKQQGATYLFGEGLFNWLIMSYGHCNGRNVKPHHDVRFQTSSGPQFWFTHFIKFLSSSSNCGNASKVEIIPKNGPYFRNEEACVWGGRLHPTYIAIVAFTFGVCKGHPFFPHFSYPAIGVVFFAGL